MRGIYTPVTDIRRKVFTEVARMSYESNEMADYAKEIRDLPFKIMPGEDSSLRSSIFLERAIVSERIRLAMGLSLRPVTESVSATEDLEHSVIADKYYEPPLINVIKFACNKCPEKIIKVTSMCQGCLAHPCQEVCPKKAISFRNGRYYVTDGQHTIEARILRNGGKDLPILCKVYTGLTMQQEALFFAEQNGHAAPLTAGIKLRAKVVGEDALSMAFLAATNRVGLDFNYDSLQLSDYRISCVGTALKLYNQMGEKIYCEALRLIVDAWEGKPDSFRAAVLKGVMYFVEVYHGEFNEERLIRALRSVHPMEIYRTGMDNPAKLPGWKKYVFPIYAAYNGKSRKDALPMKF